MASLPFIYDECRDDKLYKTANTDEEFKTMFSNRCQGNSNCTFNVDSVFNDTMLSQKCIDQRNDIKQNDKATWVVVSACSQLNIKLESINVDFPKDKLGILVVILDLLAVIAILIFVKIMKLRQIEFIR